MSEYNIELSSESINGSMNYKRKFNMSGDIGGGEAGYEFITTQGDFESDTADDYPSDTLNN